MKLLIEIPDPRPGDIVELSDGSKMVVIASMGEYLEGFIVNEKMRHRTSTWKRYISDAELRHLFSLAKEVHSGDVL